MQTIHQYQIFLQNRFTVEMPEGAVILSVGAQQEEAKLWALVDADKPLKDYTFRLFGTGHEVTDFDDSWVFLGTFQQKRGWLVWHVWWVKDA